MTDETKPTEQAQASGTAPEAGKAESSPAPAPTPKIDVDAIQKKIMQEAQAALSADKVKMQKDIARDLAARLTGEEKQQEINEYLKAFLTDTEGFLSAQHEAIVNHVTKEIEAKTAKQVNDEKALAKIGNEYPELVGEHIDYLDLEFTKLDRKDPNRPREEKIQEAAKTIAKRLKLKPISERTSEDGYISSAFPGSGGARWGAGGKDASNPKQTALDYIEQRKASFKAQRKRG